MKIDDKITDLLVQTFIKNSNKISEQNVRTAYVKLECWLSIIGNTLLGILKLILSIFTGSISLAADAAHTFGDMISSIVLLVSMQIAAIPADRKHPFGHGRAEILGTLALSAMLIVTAVEFVHASFHRITDPSIKSSDFSGVWLLIIPLLVLFGLIKEWMARFSARLGEKIKSEALVADALHHRSDAMATLLVIVSFFATSFNTTWLDGVFGIIVAGFIGWGGIHMAWLTLNRLMGEAPDIDMVSRIISAAAGVHGVMGVHGIEVHDYGNNKVVSLHVEVAGTIKTSDSHRIATMVEETIKRRLNALAVVHVEPKNEISCDFLSAREIENILIETVKKEPKLTGFHAIHITSSNRQKEINFHLTMKSDATVEECHRIEHTLSEKLIKQIGAVKVNVHCEPEK